MAPDDAETHTADDAGTHQLETHPMLAVYRHDVHKLRGRPHTAAAETVAGVRVNEPVPQGADRDAALLSRPRGDLEQTVTNHSSPARLSLLTGDPVVDGSATVDAQAPALRSLLAIEEPAQLHATWLGSTLPAQVNEAHHYPYTSLKYHTLLAAALLDNYRAGHGFEDLFLTVDPPAAPMIPTPQGHAERPGRASVVPHRTILTTPQFSLRLTAAPGDRPATRLGGLPTRSFAPVWARLPTHPLDTDERVWMLLDAQLRRIRSWSTALQYIADYTTRQASPQTGGAPAVGNGSTGNGGEQP
jgi:hypothetical protein